MIKDYLIIILAALLIALTGGAILSAQGSVLAQNENQQPGAPQTGLGGLGW